MNSRQANSLVCLLVFGPVLLASCDDGTPDSQPVGGVPVNVDVAAFPDDSSSVEELMTESVMPTIDHIWRAVSYIANAEGVTETKPETDEDWSRLRESAFALIAAGDELMDTNREILSGEFDQATASFQFTPDEIKQLIADNPQPWQSYIQQMQDTTRMTLQAIELKDLVGLQDFGAQINEACEGCHADYWYRPPGSMAPQ
jgi:hypothetical protein